MTKTGKKNTVVVKKIESITQLNGSSCSGISFRSSLYPCLPRRLSSWRWCSGKVLADSAPATSQRSPGRSRKNVRSCWSRCERSEHTSLSQLSSDKQVVVVWVLEIVKYKPSDSWRKLKATWSWQWIVTFSLLWYFEPFIQTILLNEWIN